MSLGDEIKNNPKIATTRAYLMYCSCEIEKDAYKIIEKMIKKECNYMYEFFKNKQMLGELNFKWKNNCFDKFLKLFGKKFYDKIMPKILEDDSIKNDKILDNSFETIRANRGVVAHENGNLNITIGEIDRSFQICKRAFEIVIENLEKEYMMVEIKKMSKSLEDKYFDTKKQISNYKVVSLSSRASKGSVANVKENYSIKEKKWFEEFKGL